MKTTLTRRAGATTAKSKKTAEAVGQKANQVRGVTRHLAGAYLTDGLCRLQPACERARRT